MKKKNFKNIISWLILLGAISLLIGVAQLMTSQADNASGTKESPMKLGYKVETILPEIPPIDAAVPSVFRTAAVGLG